MVKVRRVYDEPFEDEGKRYLVDRIWPRGISKSDLELDGWLKDIAPSPALRKWFSHDPVKWEEFKRRFRLELRDPQKERTLEDLAGEAGRGVVTLLFAARDREHNNAVVIKEVIEEKAK